MIKVKNVLDYLESLYPKNTACDFDNVGLLVGRKEAEVKNAVVALDCDKNTIAFAKEKGATIIGVTEALDSPLAKQSDILLAMKVTKETDRFNCQGTTSFAVTNAIFDALQSAVMEESGFVNEEFAVIHPNGAVGKRLNKTENK